MASDVDLWTVKRFRSLGTSINAPSCAGRVSLTESEREFKEVGRACNSVCRTDPQRRECLDAGGGYQLAGSFKVASLQDEAGNAARYPEHGVETASLVSQCVQRRHVQPGSCLGRAHAAQHGIAQASVLAHEEHGLQCAWIEPGNARKVSRRNVDRPSEVKGLGREQIRRRWPPLETECVRVGENLERVEIDRSKLVAQIAEAVVQQSPGCGRLARTRCADKEPCGPVALQRGGMEEEEVRPALLDGDDDRLLQLEHKLAEVGGDEGAAVVPAQDEARCRRLSAYVIAEVGVPGGVAEEGFIVLPERARCRGIVANDLDGLANDAEAEARVCQSSHRASVPD